MRISLISIILGIILLLGGGFLRCAQFPEQRVSLQYLAFQVFTDGDPKVALGSSGIRPLQLLSKSIMSTFVQDIIDRIGVTGDNRRKLAFIVGPLAFDHEDADLRRFIREAFEIAVEKNIAVGFHIDDSKFWIRRSDLWHNIRNVEWRDWKGTPSTGAKLDWGGPPVKIGPQMCFNSKVVQREVQHLARDVIGKEIKGNTNKLKESGKEELFAGVILGWETGLWRDFDDALLGYCALTNRGFSAIHPPQDPDLEREKIVHEWIELWARSLVGAGIAKEKLYSHVAFSPKSAYEEMRRQDPSSVGATYSRHVGFAPAWVAFGQNHNPGFTIYGTLGVVDELYAELAKQGNPHWASAEGTNVGQVVGVRMESYLAKMFNHGASLVNIFAWGVGGDEERNSPFRVATESAEAIAAYKKFLRGEPLKEETILERFKILLRQILF